MSTNIDKSSKKKNRSRPRRRRAPQAKKTYASLEKKVNKLVKDKNKLPIGPNQMRYLKMVADPAGQMGKQPDIDPRIIACGYPARTKRTIPFVGRVMYQFSGGTSTSGYIQVIPPNLTADANTDWQLALHYGGDPLGTGAPSTTVMSTGLSSNWTKVFVVAGAKIYLNSVILNVKSSTSAEDASGRFIAFQANANLQNDVAAWYNYSTQRHGASWTEFTAARGITVRSEIAPTSSWSPGATHLLSFPTGCPNLPSVIFTGINTTDSLLITVTAQYEIEDTNTFSPFIPTLLDPDFRDGLEQAIAELNTRLPIAVAGNSFSWKKIKSALVSTLRFVRGVAGLTGHVLAWGGFA